MSLKDLGNIPFRLSVLKDIYPDISEIAHKARRLEETEDIVRLKRGLFVATPEAGGERLNDFLIANHIYGPSYVSMHAALRYYGLIPEAVYSTTSVTLGQTKTFTNRLGTFTYIHSPSVYYPIGVTQIKEGNAVYMMATPEKALCDLVVFTQNLNLRYEDEVREWMEDEMRFDTEELRSLNLDLMRECADAGRKRTMINQIINVIQHERNV